MISVWMDINKGYDTTPPYLVITQHSDECTSSMSIHAPHVTPERLRSLANELETILERRAAVEFALARLPLSVD